MLSKRHTPEQVITKIAEGDQMLNEGKTIAEVARSFGITETTWYRCQKYLRRDEGQRRQPPLRRSKQRTEDSRSWWQT